MTTITHNKSTGVSPAHSLPSLKRSAHSCGILRTLYLAMPLCLALMALPCEPIFGEDQSDPVQITLNTYNESVSAIRKQRLTPEQKNQRRQDWLQRLLTVTAENPQSPSRFLALSTAVGLANSAGNFGKSREIILDLLGQLRDDPIEQIRWLTELGEVTEQKHRRTRSEKDRLAAIEAYEKANETIAKQLQTSPKEPRIAEQMILNLAWLGQLRSGPFAKQEESKKGAADYRRARQLLKDLGEPKERLAGTGYGAEWLSGAEAVSSAKAGDIESARNALRFLASLKDKRWPASFYVKQCAEVGFPQQGEAFRAFLLAWLDEAAEDDRSAILKCMVGESYMREKDYESARPLYEELKSKYNDALFKIDEDALLQGRGGHYADVLTNLRIIYVAIGESEKAAEVNQQFIELFPNYGNLTKEAKLTAKYLKREKERRRDIADVAETSPFRFWLIAVQVVIVLILFIAVLVRRRKAA